MTTPTGAINRRGSFRPGERVQLTDERGRITTITCSKAGSIIHIEGSSNTMNSSVRLKELLLRTLTVFFIRRCALCTKILCCLCRVVLPWCTLKMPLRLL